MKSPVKIVIFLVVAGIFGGAAELLDRTDYGRRFNQRVFLEILCGTTEGVGKSAVTFVGVDDSEKDHFESWPPPRLDWAVILKLLGPGAESERKKIEEEGADPTRKFHNAPVVGIVPPLTWDDADDVLARKAMRERALLISSLVTGAVLGPEGGEGAAVDPAKFSVVEKIEGEADLPTAGTVAGFPDESLAIAGMTAFTHVELAEELAAGRDGVLVPMLARAGDKVLAGFPLQVILAKEKLGANAVTARFGAEENVIEIRRNPAEGQSEGAIAYRIPVDAQGRLLVYPGVRGGELYPRLDAAVDVILASSDYDVVEKVREARGASQLDTLQTNAVVIGFDHADVKQFALPDGDQVSRAELMAMAVATIQSGRYIRLWPDWMRYAGLGAVAFFGLVLAPTRLISRGGLFTGFVLGIGYLAVSMLVFQTNLTWTSPLAALGICLAIVVSGWIIPTTPKGGAKPAAAGADKPVEKAATGVKESKS